MATSFRKIGLIFGKVQNIEIFEAVREKVSRIKIFQNARPTCVVIQLSGRVAMQHQQPTGCKGLDHPGKDFIAQGGASELEKDTRYDIIAMRAPIPFTDVGNVKIYRHTPCSGQSAGLCHSHIRAVHRRHVQTQLCQKKLSVIERFGTAALSIRRVKTLSRDAGSSERMMLPRRW